MQIDFHHTATYVVARAAGIDHDTARIIAHAAQYVDDATNDDEIHFSDDVQMYRRIASAHKMLDYRNFQELKNHLCWIPFHFLPGNCGEPVGGAQDAPITERLICQPDSHVARDMMRSTLLDREKPYGAHRMGVAAHVFMDTFAHQGFVGIKHEVNEVHDLRWINQQGVEEDDIYYRQRKEDLFSRSSSSPLTRLRHGLRRFRDGTGQENMTLRAKIADLAKHAFQDSIPTLGHGQALSYPDRPYAKWRYQNGLNEIVQRDNPADFIAACEGLCAWFQRWRIGDADAAVAGLPREVREKIIDMIEASRNPDGEERHEYWLQAIGRGEFGFDAEELSYVGKGFGSWKHEAVGATTGFMGKRKEVYTMTQKFVDSDWKRFHDAAKAHRRAILDDVLPAYDIFAA